MDWGRCQAANCNLPASIQSNGHMTCGHHYMIFDHEHQLQISAAIAMDKIRKTYIKVSKSPNDRWHKHWLPMLLQAKTPELRPVDMGKGVYETQNVYLNRLYKAMDQSIQGYLQVQA